MPYKQKSSSVWWISYTDAMGKRVKQSSGTTVHADAKAEEQKLRSKSHTIKRRTGGVEVGHVLAEYLKRDNRLVPRNISIGRALGSYFSGKNVASIDSVEIHGYIDFRREQEVADSTIKRDLNVLSAAIVEYNSRFGTEIPNHVRSVEVKEPPGRVRWITEQEAARLIKCASPLVADFIKIGLYTGMRTTDILTLSWKQVDLDREKIVIEVVNNSSKRKRTIIIPIHPMVREAIASCKARNPGAQNAFQNGDAVIRSLKKGFEGACRRAGIEDFTPHDLRHTCASWLVMAGVNLYEVRDILGHASIKSTERYAHLAPENLVGAIGKLSSV